MASWMGTMTRVRIIRSAAHTSSTPTARAAALITRAATYTQNRRLRAASAWAATAVDVSLLKKCFGGFLIVVGLMELFGKKKD